MADLDPNTIRTIKVVARIAFRKVTSRPDLDIIVFILAKKPATRYNPKSFLSENTNLISDSKFTSALSTIKNFQITAHRETKDIK